jgi:hypothetical protein
MRLHGTGFHLPALAKERARKRSELLDATEAGLATIALSVQSGRLKGADKIGLRVGRHANRYKMAKHFEIVIGDDSLSFSRLKARDLVRRRERSAVPFPDAAVARPVRSALRRD